MNPKDITVYMIGNAHIDPVWLWKWQEGFAEVHATCRSALDRMNEYPDFVFTRADAATYKWIEDSCPEMFEEIRQRVKEGRWSIVGGWWEQPDCNIPSGESFVRHELYGKRYFLDKFGVDVKTGYNVDSFGHNAGLPQILSKAGIKYYVFMRPEQHEKELPNSLFWWEGPDGSRVLVLRLRGPYCIWGHDLAAFVNEAIEDRPKGTDVTARFYGVGNHGGGPTIENLEQIRKLQADPDAPDVIFGTLEQFFEHVMREKPDIPVVKGDLQHHAVGCYTAHSGVKMWNRRAENALGAAERSCAMAKIGSGRGFPKARFAEAWQKVLFNQFHDILAGTSLDVAYEDVRNSMGAVIDTAEYEMTAALQSIACKINVDGEGDAFVVFNPHIHAIRSMIYFDENGRSLRDCGGRAIPVQTATPFYEHTGPRAKKVFVDTLPPLGYRLYYSGNWDEAPAANRLTADTSALENDFYRVEIDGDSGEIVKITDLRTNTNVLDAPAGAVVIEDKSDTWSHGVVSYNEVAGRFGDAKIELIENGPVRATLRIESRFGESVMWRDVSLYAELPLIEFRVNLDWHEKHKVLKFEFPLDLEDCAASYDAAYSFATHPTDGAENPGQKWIDVTGRSGEEVYGVSLLNDGKYGFDVEDSTMRLTALRSPIYAFHDPRQVEEGKRYHYMDQGMHSFTFALLPHQGLWQEAGTVREAEVMNMPPVAVETSQHPGEWLGERSFGWVKKPNIDVCAIKEAEEDDSLIVRVRETEGKALGEAKLILDGSKYSFSIEAYELKTLRIKGGDCREVDLVERK